MPFSTGLKIVKGWSGALPFVLLQSYLEVRERSRAAIAELIVMADPFEETDHNGRKAGGMDFFGAESGGVEIASFL